MLHETDERVGKKSTQTTTDIFCLIYFVLSAHIEEIRDVDKIMFTCMFHKTKKERKKESLNFLPYPQSE
jgi:hypothetical protein